MDGGATATYSYDALNHRVETTLGNSATPTVFLYNLAGKRVSEWQYNGLSGLGFLKGHYYFGNRPVAYYTVANLTTMPTLTFEHQDWLGTERMRTTSTGVVLADYTSLPFGDNQTTVPVEHYVPGLLYDTDAAHYAMLDHDTETNTDHAEFRQYDNQQGRWMSPDPYLGSYDAANPQSFDRYSYVENMPLSFIDVSGLEKWWLTGDGYYCHSWVDENGNGYVECMYIGGGQQINPTYNVNSGGGIRRAWEYEKKAIVCNLSTLKHNGVATALDFASLGGDAFGPEEQYAKLALGLSLSTGSTINSAVNKDVPGTELGMTSYLRSTTELAANSAKWGWAKWVPYVGAIVDVASTFNDVSQGIDYNLNCMAGH